MQFRGQKQNKMQEPYADFYIGQDWYIYTGPHVFSGQSLL